MPDRDLPRESDYDPAQLERVVGAAVSLVNEHRQLEIAYEGALRRWNDPAALRARLQELANGSVRVAAVGIFLLAISAPLSPWW